MNLHEIRKALGGPRNFRYAAGGGTLVQPYALLHRILWGQGLHQHHLIPKSLFLNGPLWARPLGDYIPSVPLAREEHLAALHPVLNEYLREHGLWQRPLGARDIEAALDLAARFYRLRGIAHFAAAVLEFRERVFREVRPRRGRYAA